MRHLFALCLLLWITVDLWITCEEGCQTQGKVWGFCTLLLVVKCNLMLLIVLFDMIVVCWCYPLCGECNYKKRDRLVIIINSPTKLIKCLNWELTEIKHRTVNFEAWKLLQNKVVLENSEVNVQNCWKIISKSNSPGSWTSHNDLR